MDTEQVEPYAAAVEALGDIARTLMAVDHQLDRIATALERSLEHEQALTHRNQTT